MVSKIVGNKTVVRVRTLAQQSAGFRGQVAGAGQHIGHHSGKDQNEGNNAGDGSGVIGFHGSEPVKVAKCY